MTKCATCGDRVGKKSWLLCPKHWIELPPFHKTELETTRQAYEETLEEELPEANQRKAFNTHVCAIDNALLFLGRLS